MLASLSAKLPNDRPTSWKGVTSVNVLFEGSSSKIRVGELNGFEFGVVGTIGTDSATRTLPLGRTAAGSSVAPICSGPRAGLDKSNGKSGPLLQMPVFES